MKDPNKRAGAIAAAIVGAATLIIGLIPKSAAGGMECGSILAPGRHASFPGCDGVNTVPAGLLWVVFLASAGVGVYFVFSDSQ